MAKRASLESRRKPTRGRALKILNTVLSHMSAKGKLMTGIFGGHFVHQTERYTARCAAAPGCSEVPNPVVEPARWLRLKSRTLPHSLTIADRSRAVFHIQWDDRSNVTLHVFTPGPWMDDILYPKGGVGVPGLAYRDWSRS